jgi:hypothetical protein
VLKDEIEKRNSIKKRKKKPESTCLTYKTRDSGHEIMITSYKENKKNDYKTQFSINLKQHY